MEALIEEAQGLAQLALAQADAALESIREAQRVCDEILGA